MRKFVIIVVTLLLLIASFLVYLHFQPRIGAINTQPAPLVGTGFTTTKDSNTPFGPGKSPWIRQYREGILAYQFKADFYGNKEPGGTIPVTAPVIEIFQTDGQVIRIEGADGMIRTSPGDEHMSFSSAPHSPPSSGILRDVVVKMYGSADLENNRPESPDLTLTMSNAQFDNDTFRLFTQEYTNAFGKLIHADEVPVTLRAQDYSFDGSGLVMFWNGMDQQLKSIEIAHGTKLTINNSSQFSPREMVSDAPPPAPAPSVAPLQAAPTSPRPSTPAAAVAQQAATTKPAAPQRYQAIFFDDVHVVQADQEIKNADQMQIDFVPKHQATANPSRGDASLPAKTDSAATPGSTAAPANQGVVASGNSAPAGNASAQPINIYWKGKMRMVPLDDPNAEPLAVGQSIVRFIGAPVLVSQTTPPQPAGAGQPGAPPSGATDFDAQAATIVYRTADSIVHLLSSPRTPVTLAQKHLDGTVSAVNSSGSMQFSRADRRAIIEGPSNARFPDPNDPKSVLTADWNKSCIVNLVPDEKGEMQIQKCDLSGNVTVTHPRFNLNSSDLTLVFDPKSAGNSAQVKGDANSPQLKEIDASGDAICVVHETDQRARSIAGQRLQLLTALGSDGRVYAKTINADGSTHAIEDDQVLTSEHLAIALRPVDPAKRPAVNVSAAKGGAQNGAANGGAAVASAGDIELQSLHATDTVRVKGKDSSIAAEDMQVDRENGFSKVTLKGAPAMVVSATSTIIGPEIHLSSADQTSSIVGPGTLTHLPPASDPNGKPLTLEWKDRALLDGKADTIEIFGDVYPESKSPDGTVDRAHGDHLMVNLIDAPATQPSTGEFDFMRNKQVKSLSLVDNTKTRKAQAESKLTDAAGNILRWTRLWGNQIDFENAAGRLTIPGPGIMWVEDHMPVAAPAAGANAAGPGFRGQTVFNWNEKLIYDQSKRNAFIAGDVTIGHTDDGPNGKRINLKHADEVTTVFEPTDSQATDKAAPAGKPAAAQGDLENPHLQLSHMIAIGPAIEIEAGDSVITCGEVEYLPKLLRLVCRGGQARVVNFKDAQRRGGAQADEVWINTKTNSIDKVINLSGHGQN